MGDIMGGHHGFASWGDIMGDIKGDIKGDALCGQGGLRDRLFAFLRKWALVLL